MSIILNRNIKRILICLSILALLLMGCGTGAEKKEAQDNAANEIPSIDKYDEKMSRAHFISAPLSAYEETGITEYNVSCKMEIQDTSACFVLGDGKGRYGKLILCEIENYDSDAKFSIKEMSEGRVFEDGQSVDIQSLEYTSDGYAEDDKTEDANKKTAAYDIRLTIDSGNLNAYINDEYVGEFNIPDFSLGCVGVYKSRGTSYAYIDDICITGVDESDILVSDDFDGNFINNLYKYDYKNEPENIFSPFYTKITDGIMRISSGLTLTETKTTPAPLFERKFDIKKSRVKAAYIYMTALGSFDISLNGERVSNDYFSPGKIIYDKYLSYVAYDITDMLQNENTLDVMLLHGFYDRGVGYPEVFSPWGDTPALKGELVIEYKNGDVEIIPTDERFTVTNDTNVIFDDIYQGEILSGIKNDDKERSFEAPLVDAVDEKYLSLPIEEKENEAIREIMTLSPISVNEPIEGVYVYDFGQNFSGSIRLNLKEIFDKDDEGKVITLRYGELLNNDALVNSDDIGGTIWTQNLLSANATDYYIVGDTSDDIEFRYTYHGFRYLQITGIDEQIPIENIKAAVLSSDLKKTGEFSSSSDALNRLYENSRFSIISNFMDNPTDCNQRDERLGWSGDAQGSSGFAGFIFDTESFYKKYLKEMRLMQAENGAYTDIAPGVQRSDFYTLGNSGGNNCWGDAPVMMAWNLYLQYGDTGVLSDNYESIKKWVDYLVTTSDNYLRDAGGYGDHLSAQGTPAALTDTAWCAESAYLLSKMSYILGYNDDFEKYSDIYDKFKKRWQQEYIRDDASVASGILTEESETAYSLGLSFGLFSDDMEADAAERLNILTEYGGYLFYPGYSGMRYYLPTLADYGYLESAMRVLENDAPGSLLWGVNFGLTTNPETLYFMNFYDKDGNPYGEGKYRIEGSLNHMAYSAVSEFMFTNILGIKPDENAPGYKHFYLSPQIGGSLTHAEGSYESRYGIISIEWDTIECTLKCVIPDDTTCTLTLPDGDVKELGAGSFEFPIY